MKIFIFLIILSGRAFAGDPKVACPRSMDLGFRVDQQVVQAKLLRTTAVFSGFYKRWDGNILDKWRCDYHASGKLPGNRNLTSAVLITGEELPSYFSGLILSTDTSD